ncbi:ribosomal RNA processing protein 1 homolog B [Xenentodon cancila]
MTSVLDPEVQLAQKLASNEKPVRTKAMKRLRKYVSARSQVAAGGFSSDELLRLWKGLFYCLWMQDKPLLQEDLSNQISTLIHSFHHIDSQLLYLETFLQTIRREWTGIDRLRMDKFYQLVRFMFRQTFEVLKRRSWNIRFVTQFVDLLTCEVLQNNCEASSGLQLHILDLYLNELAAVGSAELTADQNFVFIEPFCRTAAKTKNRTLFGAICKNIFSTIIEQAPFAIEDLMKEVLATEEEDSGQESEEEEERQGKEKSNSKAVRGIKSNKAEKKNDDDDYLYQSEGSDAELHDIGPVLQFDYGAVADRLFDVASRSGTPGRNRQRLYRIIKVLRDLSEGVFPEDEYPEEVSTDEDDDMFGSRKRMKRSHGHTEDDEKATTKRSKANAGKATALNNKDKTIKPFNVLDQNQSQGRKNELNKELDSDSKPKDQEMKKQQASSEGDPPDLETRRMKDEAESKISPVSAEETLAASSEDGNAATSLKKRWRQKIKLTDESLAEGVNPSAKVQAEGLPDSAENCLTSGFVNQPDAASTAKKKKKKKKSALLVDVKRNDVADSGDVPELAPAASQLSTVVPVGKITKKNKGGKDQLHEEASSGDGSDMKKNWEEPDASPAGDSLETEITQEEPKTTEKESVITATTPSNKNKRKRKKLTGDQLSEVSDESQVKRVSGGMQVNQAGLTKSELPSAVTDVMNCGKPVRRRRKIPVEFEFEADELEETTRNHVTEEKTGERTTECQVVGEPSVAPSLKKSQKKIKTAAKSGSDFLSFQSKATVPTPLFCKTRGSSTTPLSFKKVRNQTPQSESKKVTFGLKNNKTAEFRKTDRSLLLSPDGSSRIPFDPEQKPKCGVLKSPPTSIKTPISSRNSASKVLKRRPKAVDFF